MKLDPSTLAGKGTKSFETGPALEIWALRAG